MVNPESKSPILVYDGDCGICLEWVNYWRKYTGETVAYLPYQKAAVDYPKISIESFKQSIQYIETDGKITAGAEACLRLLKQKLSYKFLYWLYLHLPGFSMICEFGYAYFSHPTVAQAHSPRRVGSAVAPCRLPRLSPTCRT